MGMTMNNKTYTKIMHLGRIRATTNSKITLTTNKGTKISNTTRITNNIPTNPNPKIASLSSNIKIISIHKMKFNRGKSGNKCKCKRTPGSMDNNMGNINKHNHILNNKTTIHNSHMPLNLNAHRKSQLTRNHITSLNIKIKFIMITEVYSMARKDSGKKSNRNKKNILIFPQGPYLISRTLKTSEMMSWRTQLCRL